MKNTAKTLNRQGDVLIERVNSLPAGGSLIQPENGKTILAHGEVTGHHHALDSNVATLYDLGMGENERFMQLVEDADLTHQEHDPIQLKAGAYRVTRQREYSPEAIRNVAD